MQENLSYLIKIKPLSINKAFQWRKFKTKDYIRFENEIFYLLPSIKIPDWSLYIEIDFWFSKDTDIDNCIKPFFDIMQKKYSFNDSRIVKMLITKHKTNKWNEFINFRIDKL